MEDLITLTRLLSVQKVKQIEIITEDAEMSPKTKMFYEAIKNGELQSDEEAAALLYDSTPNHAAYRKLKYRLKQRLINTLFFIDIQSYSKSEYQKAHAKALKNWAAFKILIDKGLRKTGVSIAESVLQLAKTNDLIELSLFILKDLKYQYGIFIENEYKYKKYESEYYEVKRLFDLREKVDHIYIRIARIILKSKSYSFNEELKEFEQELEKILSQNLIYNSYYTSFYAFESIYYIKQIKRDYKSQLIIVNNALDFFQERKKFNMVGYFTFTLKKGMASLSNEDFTNAISSFNECIEIIPTKGKISWHNIYNFLFIAHILKKDYESALAVLSTVTNHKGHKTLGEKFREPWYLKEAFIHFLIRINKIDAESLEKSPLRSFRLSRFLNEVSTFSKDKRGYNITINIIQMLFLIVDEKYDQVLDKLSALRQYNFRYLKRPEYTRSSNFVKMLLKIPEGDYKASTIRKKAHKYHLKLLESPNDYSEHAMSLEIIPYEQLWEEILSMFPD